MKSLIFGVTGMVGEFIADHLIRRGDRPYRVSRRSDPDKWPKG
jgi:GDP-D-mannose dehydratase